MALSPDGDTVWAATTDGVWVSKDAGTSWTLSLDVPMATSLSIDPTNDQDILVGCGGFGSAGRGIYRTVDGGDRWTLITTGVPSQFLGKIILDRAPSDPNVVYASIGHRNDAFGLENQQRITWLMRSDNGGSSWSIRNTTDYAAFQGWYSHFVMVFPDDPNHLVVAGVRLFESTDGGLTLEPVNYTVTDNAVMVDFHAGLFHPNSNRFFLASDQGIYSTEDGLHFEPRQHGYQTTQFYRGTAQAPDDKNLLIGTPQDRLGTIYAGSPDWLASSQGHEGGYSVFKPDNSSIYLIGTAHMQLLERYGLDDPVQDIPVLGDPTEDIFVNTNFNTPLVLAPSDAKVVYSGRSVLYRSTDFGSSWAIRNDGQELDGNPIGVIAMSYQDFNSLYVATSPRKGPMHVYRTSDGGQSFSDISAGLPDRWPTSIAVVPRNDRKAYISFSGFGSSHLFKTEDHGQTWVDLDGGRLPDIPINSVFLDPDYPDHIYLGLDFGVVVSLDGGHTWMQFNENLPEAVMVMDLITYQPDRTIRLVTHGNGIYERKLLDPEDQPTIGQRLVYPWISQNEGLFESTLVANNLSGLPVAVSLTARRADGTSESVVRHIEAGGMLAEKASTLFPQLGSGLGYSCSPGSAGSRNLWSLGHR